MKRIIIGFAILFAVSAVNAQAIKENKTDEFTGYNIVRTSWERIATQNWGTMYCRVSKINNIYYFDVKYSNGAVLTIADKAEIMFKLTSGKVITMTSIEHAIGAVKN